MARNFGQQIAIPAELIIKKAEQVETTPPPYLIEPPDMAAYEVRGARMLSAASYKGKCFQCAWAAMAHKPRAVPYKDCGSVYDEGWMDDLCTEGRGEDD